MIIVDVLVLHSWITDETTLNSINCNLWRAKVLRSIRNWVVLLKSSLTVAFLTGAFHVVNVNLVAEVKDLGKRTFLANNSYKRQILIPEITLNSSANVTCVMFTLTEYLLFLKRKHRRFHNIHNFMNSFF